MTSWNIEYAMNAVKNILLKMPYEIDGSVAMFNTVVKGFVLPSDSNLSRFPLACVLPPSGHVPQYSEIPYVTTRHACILPVFAYFKTHDPEEAVNLMIRFIGSLNEALINSDYCANWDTGLKEIGLTMKLNSSDTGQVLRRVDIDYEINLPFWGVLAEVSVEWSDSKF